MNTVAIRRVYVWELPVRFYHWINAVAVVVLAVLLVVAYFIVTSGAFFKGFILPKVGAPCRRASGSSRDASSAVANASAAAL